MLDPKTLMHIKKEERGYQRAMKSKIVNSKLSPEKKQAKWNAEFNPTYTDDLSYLAGGIY